MNTENSIRRKILELSRIGGEGHIGPSFSVVEILSAAISLSFESDDLSFSAENLILSKGHAALALYATLIEYGYISSDEFAKFAKTGSSYGGHPSSSSNKSIIFSTGSLGHGLPLALGRMFEEQKTISNKKYIVVLGDGELNEGSNWEAMLLAKKFQMNNVLLMIDDNGSSTRAIDLSNLGDKLRAFGYEVMNANGHSVRDLKEKIRHSFQASHMSCIIAKTKKGYGTSLTQDNPVWHHRVPNDIEFEKMMGELKNVE